MFKILDFTGGLLIYFQRTLVPHFSHSTCWTPDRSRKLFLYSSLSGQKLSTLYLGNIMSPRCMRTLLTQALMVYKLMGIYQNTKHMSNHQKDAFARSDNLWRSLSILFLAPSKLPGTYFKTLHRPAAQ